MSSVRARPRWFFLITPRWLGWHAFAVVATIGMLWLGDWQFHRAESGNALSWAYTFEWPIFAVFGVVFWAKTIRDEFKPQTDPGDAPEVELPAGAGASAAAGISRDAEGGVSAGVRGPGARAVAEQDEDEDDPELAAYNAYLTRLNEQVKGHGRWHGLR
jgi:hypothetical protein